MAGPTVHAVAVLGYEGWLAGYQLAFDTAKSKVTQNNFALGYKAGDFQLHTNVWVTTSQRKEAGNGSDSLDEDSKQEEAFPQDETKFRLISTATDLYFLYLCFADVFQ